MNIYWISVVSVAGICSLAGLSNCRVSKMYCDVGATKLGIYAESHIADCLSVNFKLGSAKSRPYSIEGQCKVTAGFFDSFSGNAILNPLHYEISDVASDSYIKKYVGNVGNAKHEGKTALEMNVVPVSLLQKYNSNSMHNVIFLDAGLFFFINSNDIFNAKSIVRVLRNRVGISLNHKYLGLSSEIRSTQKYKPKELYYRNDDSARTSKSVFKSKHVDPNTNNNTYSEYGYFEKASGVSSLSSILLKKGVSSHWYCNFNFISELVLSNNSLLSFEVSYGAGLSGFRSYKVDVSDDDIIPLYSREDGGWMLRLATSIGRILNDSYSCSIRYSFETALHNDKIMSVYEEDAVWATKNYKILETRDCGISSFWIADLMVCLEIVV